MSETRVAQGTSPIVYKDLLGTTMAGGASNLGTVFELAAGSSTITTLASFNGANGA